MVRAPHVTVGRVTCVPAPHAGFSSLSLLCSLQKYSSTLGVTKIHALLHVCVRVSEGIVCGADAAIKTCIRRFTAPPSRPLPSPPLLSTLFLVQTMAPSAGGTVVQAAGASAVFGALALDNDVDLSYLSTTSPIIIWYVQYAYIRTFTQLLEVWFLSAAKSGGKGDQESARTTLRFRRGQTLSFWWYKINSKECWIHVFVRRGKRSWPARRATCFLLV